MSLFASLGSAEEVDHSLWGEGGLFGSNPVQDILDRGDGAFTLEELLEEDELIQEVKHLNGKLIEFLSRRATVRQLVAYVTRDDTRDEADVLQAAAAANALAEEAEEEEKAAEAEAAEAEAEAGTADSTAAASANEEGDGGEAEAGAGGGNGTKSREPSQTMLEMLHEKERLARFAYTASEIFCCEVPGVNHHLLEMEGVPAPGDDMPSRPETITEGEPLPDGPLSIAAAAGDDALAGVSSELAKEGPLIGQFFAVLYRPAVSARTAGYMEKIVDVFIQRDLDMSRLARFVNANPDLLPRFVHHLSMISVSNVFRKMLDATDLAPLPVDDNSNGTEGDAETFGNLLNSDGEDDDMPSPMSEGDLMSMTFGKRGGMGASIGGEGGRRRMRILWA